MAEPVAEAAILSALEEGDRAIDVGANSKGTPHVSAMSWAVGESGRVIAVDPFPLAELYQEAMEHGNVHVVAEAVADGYVALEEGPEACGADHPRSDRSYEGHVPLDHLATPDLVKVDVEGAEVDVLNSGPDTLQDVRPHWIVELHFWKSPDGFPDVVVNMFVEENYAVVSLASGRLIGSADELYGDPARIHAYPR